MNLLPLFHFHLFLSAALCLPLTHPPARSPPLPRQASVRAAVRGAESFITRFFFCACPFWSSRLRSLPGLGRSSKAMYSVCLDKKRASSWQARLKRVKSIIQDVSKKAAGNTACSQKQQELMRFFFFLCVCSCLQHVSSQHGSSYVTTHSVAWLNESSLCALTCTVFNPCESLLLCNESVAAAVLVERCIKANKRIKTLKCGSFIYLFYGFLFQFECRIMCSLLLFFFLFLILERRVKVSPWPENAWLDCSLVCDVVLIRFICN